MKIDKYFLLTTEFPPFYGGGISTYAFHTAQMLSKRNIEVTVFVPDGDLEKDLIIDEKGKIRVVRFRLGNKTYYSFLGQIFAQSYQFAEILKYFIEKEGFPDVVEIQDYLAIGYYLLQRKYALEKPFKDLKVIMTLHTPKFVCDFYNEAPMYKFPDYFIGEAEKWCIKAVNGVISPSKYLADELKRWDELKDVSVEVIHNPFVFGDFQGRKSGRDLVFFGRLEKRKGVFEVLSYMAELWKEGLELPLYLIGGDTFFHPKGTTCSELIKKKYKRFIHEGYIVIEGKKKPEELKDRLRNKTKVGIIGSIFENFPYALLELIEAGVVSFVSDSGGQAEVIEDEQSGFVFSHKKPETFKKKLLKLISLSESELQNFRINALNRAKELSSYENVYEKKLNFIERILNKKTKFSLYPYLREFENIESTISSNYSVSLEENLLSIVIPYYNLGRLLIETIEAVENSTYPKKEIIVVNDGSNEEESLKVLEEISKTKTHIKIINKKNEGLALARNTGAFNAKGEFLAFIDADDLVDREYYSLAIEILKTYENVSFVGCWVKYFEGSDTVWPTFTPEFPYFLFHNTINSSGLVLKTEDFLKYGLNDPEMKYGMEDYDFVINLVKNNKRGVVIPRELFFYRVRKHSMLRQFNPYTYLYLYDKISQKHDRLFKKFGSELFNLQNANGPAFLIDNPTWESQFFNYIKQDKKQETELLMIPAEVKETLKKLWRYKIIRLTGKVLSKILK